MSRIKHPGEFISVASAVLLTMGAAYFFWLLPDWSPSGDAPKYLLAWMVVAYVAVQLLTLLETVASVRLFGLLDSVTAILPFVTGLVALINSAQGVVHLSEFQMQALYLLLATSLLDFIVTMWIRFVVNRRTVGLDVAPAGIA